MPANAPFILIHPPFNGPATLHRTFRTYVNVSLPSLCTSGHRIAVLFAFCFEFHSCIVCRARDPWATTFSSTMKSSGLSVFVSALLVSLPRVADCLTVNATMAGNGTSSSQIVSLTTPLPHATGHRVPRNTTLRLTKFLIFFFFNRQCNALEAAGLTILRPNSTAYQTRDTSYFSVSEHLSPYCIVQPKDTAEVASTVNILRESTTNWAVRGGGHMTWAGSANSMPLLPISRCSPNRYLLTVRVTFS